MHTAYLISGDLALAEDHVQTAFLRVAYKIDQFDEQRAFRPWFLRTVVNDAIKATQRQLKSVSLYEPADEAVSDWLMDKAPRPEELAQASDLRQKVWTALRRLPPEQRAVIVQRHFLEMSEAEMVEKLQVPASTVKMVAAQRPEKPESPFGRRKS